MAPRCWDTSRCRTRAVKTGHNDATLSLSQQQHRYESKKPAKKGRELQEISWSHSYKPCHDVQFAMGTMTRREGCLIKISSSIGVCVDNHGRAWTSREGTRLRNQLGPGQCCSHPQVRHISPRPTSGFPPLRACRTLLKIGLDPREILASRQGSGNFRQEANHDGLRQDK